MVDLALVALALVALLAVWLFLRGTDDGRFSRGKGPPAGSAARKTPRRRTGPRESRGPGLYRSMLLSQRRSGPERGPERRPSPTDRSP